MEVRSDWVAVGSKLEPTEYSILLCTGGPAVKVMGQLDEHREPTTAALYHQDWFTPWILYTEADETVLMKFVSYFYFGE